ncbi:MAG: NAD kinase [Propionibacteriaceae bacterium]
MTAGPASDRPTEPGVRRVAILTHTGRAEAVKLLDRLVAGLSSAGIVSMVPPDDLALLRSGAPDTRAEELTGVESRGSADGDMGVCHERPPGDFELLVVLGGDGTILRGAEWVVDTDTPLLGVNLGHVGFLAEAESSEIDLIVEHVVHRSYAVEERLTIDVTVYADEHPVWSSFAINEVSIEKAARERMIEILVEIDGRPLSRWACDGLIVATPTGSTAYAFSAGGPVIWPGVEALLVVPLSAHALFARPLVLSPDSHLVIEVLHQTPTEGVVWCDGRRSTPLCRGMEVEVVQGRRRLRLARLSQAPFTDRLVRKFGLRVEGWRGRVPGT